MRRRTVLLLLAVFLILLALAIVGFFLLREKIRADRQKEAEEYRFTSASLSADFFVSPPGEAVSLTATANGGKGTLLYEFYTVQGETKTVFREASPENTATFSSEEPGLYDIYVRVCDESPMTGDITASCRYGAAVKGLDVSLYQRDIDWEAVKADGFDFVLIRTGYGWGETQADPAFSSNIKGAKNAGLAVGAYHYSYAMTEDEARMEADLCTSVLADSDVSLDLPVFFDIEGEEQRELSEGALSLLVDAFCSEVEKAGYTPGIYTYDSWLVAHNGWESLTSHDVWVASWDSDPETPGAFTIWQYTNNGSVPGINGAVDLNYLFCRYVGGKKQ